VDSNRRLLEDGPVSIKMWVPLTLNNNIVDHPKLP